MTLDIIYACISVKNDPQYEYHENVSNPYRYGLCPTFLIYCCTKWVAVLFVMVVCCRLLFVLALLHPFCPSKPCTTPAIGQRDRLTPQKNVFCVFNQRFDFDKNFFSGKINISSSILSSNTPFIAKRDGFMCL